MPPVRRRAAEPSATILAAAVHVFAARGFAAATLEEIARRAGFSHQTVRDRFVDKARLWRAVQQEEWDRLLAGVTRRVARGATPRDRLSGAVDTLAQLAIGSVPRVQLLMRCDPAAPLSDDIGDLRQWLITLLADAGAARPATHAAMLLGGLCGLCGRHRPDGVPTAEVMREVLRLAFAG